MPTTRLPIAAEGPDFYDALQRGAADFADAVCFAACPFDVEDLREAWRDGWLGAQECAEGALLAECL